MDAWNLIFLCLHVLKPNSNRACHYTSIHADGLVKTHVGYTDYEGIHTVFQLMIWRSTELSN